MNIYLWKEDIEDGASVMTVEYRPVEYGKDYDVVNNPDIFVNNPVPVSLLSGDRKPQIRFLGNHPSGSGNLYHKSFRM